MFPGGSCSTHGGDDCALASRSINVAAFDYSHGAGLAADSPAELGWRSLCHQPASQPLRRSLRCNRHRNRSKAEGTAPGTRPEDRRAARGHPIEPIKQSNRSNAMANRGGHPNAGARVQGDETDPQPLMTEVPQVAARRNSWTAQAGIPLVVSGSYRSPRYSVIDAILGALVEPCLRAFSDRRRESGLHHEARQTRSWRPTGSRSSYWIDDRQQHEAARTRRQSERFRSSHATAETCRPLCCLCATPQAVLLVDKHGHITAVAWHRELDGHLHRLALPVSDGTGGAAASTRATCVHIRPFVPTVWPVVEDFMARRRVAPETLEDAVAVEFSPNIAAPLRSRLSGPGLHRGQRMAEWNRLTSPRRHSSIS